MPACHSAKSVVRTDPEVLDAWQTQIRALVQPRRGAKLHLSSRPSPGKPCSYHRKQTPVQLVKGLGQIASPPTQPWQLL